MLRYGVQQLILILFMCGCKTVGALVAVRSIRSIAICDHTLYGLYVLDGCLVIVIIIFSRVNG